eukprot:g2778.t1
MLYERGQPGEDFIDEVVEDVFRPSEFKQLIEGKITAKEAFAPDFLRRKQDPTIAGPFGGFPWLVDTDDAGEKFELAQTLAISSYVADKFGLTPSNIKERARCKMVCALIYEEFVMKLFQTVRGTQPAAFLLGKASNPMPNTFGFFLRRLEGLMPQSRTYMCGNIPGELSEADFWLFYGLDILYTVLLHPKANAGAREGEGRFAMDVLLGPCPGLRQFHSRMLQQRGVVEAQRAPKYMPWLTGLMDLEVEKYGPFAAGLAAYLRENDDGSGAQSARL